MPIRKVIVIHIITACSDFPAENKRKNITPCQGEVVSCDYFGCGPHCCSTQWKNAASTTQYWTGFFASAYLVLRVSRVLRVTIPLPSIVAGWRRTIFQLRRIRIYSSFSQRLLYLLNQITFNLIKRKCKASKNHPSTLQGEHSPSKRGYKYWLKGFSTKPP